MATEFLYRVGIDPAWKNLGLSIVREHPKTGELSLVHSCVMNPSTFPSISKFVEALDTVVWEKIVEDRTVHQRSTGNGVNLVSATIERFVAYAGVSTTETENICMIIGALQYMFAAESHWQIEPLMLRAIDWKTTLVKQLYKKKGFENPSVKLDKKFSIAAAKACLDHDHKFATDHEADATCLAAYPVLVGKKK